MLEKPIFCLPRHKRLWLKVSIVKIRWVSSFLNGWGWRGVASPLVYSCLQYWPVHPLVSLDWTDHCLIKYCVFLVVMITIPTKHCTPCPWAVSLSDIVIRTLPMTCDRTNPRKQYSKTERTTFYQMKLSALFGIIVRFMIKWKFL